ncbi:hypothetical protein CAEBREN_07945 [Caenorhabditis brenneri]|uniref:Uncharacterized protein n=1 Tax=Caenorhabditis brenneri TaxID=135651 RepID=G0NDW9_CAEBE|nr:hypothetical protein CAEBREN_07945 [Caenorhabditis brenneri]
MRFVEKKRTIIPSLQETGQESEKIKERSKVIIHKLEFQLQRKMAEVDNRERCLAMEENPRMVIDKLKMLEAFQKDFKNSSEVSNETLEDGAGKKMGCVYNNCTALSNTNLTLTSDSTTTDWQHEVHWPRHEELCQHNLQKVKKVCRTHEDLLEFYKKHTKDSVGNLVTMQWTTRDSTPGSTDKSAAPQLKPHG